MSDSDPSMIRLEVVSERKHLRDFLALPHRLYASDSAWVAPLDFEQKERFSPHNHFFQHARWRGWVAFKDGRPVGRITAQIDEMHLQQHNDAAGYFGMLEADDDPAIFAALFGAAEEWLASEGMQCVRGPFNLHINEELGLLVDGFTTPPFVLMGHARPYYGGAIEAQGYKPVQDLLAYHVRPDFEAPSVMTKLAQRVSQRVVVRCASRKDLTRDAEIMRDIFNDAWQNNWGFVPLAAADWEDTSTGPKTPPTTSA